LLAGCRSADIFFSHASSSAASSASCKFQVPHVKRSACACSDPLLCSAQCSAAWTVLMGMRARTWSSSNMYICNVTEHKHKRRKRHTDTGTGMVTGEGYWNRHRQRDTSTAHALTHYRTETQIQVEEKKTSSSGGRWDHGSSWKRGSSAGAHGHGIADQGISRPSKNTPWWAKRLGPRKHKRRTISWLSCLAQPDRCQNTGERGATDSLCKLLLTQACQTQGSLPPVNAILNFSLLCSYQNVAPHGKEKKTGSTRIWRT
jgi:hypothetical protein